MAPRKPAARKGKVVAEAPGAPESTPPAAVGSDPSGSAAASSPAVDLAPVDPPSADSDLGVPAAPTPGTGLSPEGSPVRATQSPAAQPAPATASSSTPKRSATADSNVGSAKRARVSAPSRPPGLERDVWCIACLRRLDGHPGHKCLHQTGAGRKCTHCSAGGHVCQHLPNELVDLAQRYLAAAECRDASDDRFMDFVHVRGELFRALPSSRESRSASSVAPATLQLPAELLAVLTRIADALEGQLARSAPAPTPAAKRGGGARK
ncbi:uncharacterized protein DNG_03230 [Cephalotrichum gorgonifer]|uniref:Uncharacterized protein n=1 Tax=Cephalotrichum gorgonifer TaxID=2041049 RepID=A0AAE8MUV8_9PEZI|nr:uncharacterized protein DNG_03230 [Cephalotrichum gorgonifer]